MEDISDLTGDVILQIGGKSYLMDNVGFDDYGVFKGHAIAMRKREILLATNSLLQSLKTGEITKEEYDAWRRDAISQASQVREMGKDEVISLLFSNEGAALMLWVMLERRYPQKVKLDAIEKALKEDAIDSMHVAGLFKTMLKAMGALMPEDPNKPEGGEDGEGNSGNEGSQAEKSEAVGA